MATRTAGAICTVVLISGSSTAAQTVSTLFFTTIAPVGHTTAHWPQPTQGDSAKGLPKAVLMVIFEPRKAKSIAPTCWVSLHIRTQSPQRMHLPGSRVMQTEELSSTGRCLLLGKRTPSIWKRMARSCSLQLVLLSQVVQSRQWLASRSSRMFLRYRRSRSVLVLIFMPARGGVEQAASSPPHSFSTMHIRQAP